MSTVGQQCASYNQLCDAIYGDTEETKVIWLSCIHAAHMLSDCQFPELNAQDFTLIAK